MQTQPHAHVHLIGGVSLGLYMNGSPPKKQQPYKISFVLSHPTQASVMETPNSNLEISLVRD